MINNEIAESAVGKWVWPVVVSEKGDTKFFPGTLWATDDSYVIDNSRKIGNIQWRYRFTIPPEAVMGFYEDPKAGYLELRINGALLPVGKTLRELLEGQKVWH